MRGPRPTTRAARCTTHDAAGTTHHAPRTAVIAAKVNEPTEVHFVPNIRASPCVAVSMHTSRSVRIPNTVPCYHTCQASPWPSSVLPDL